jgi:surfeit locus 1 family protein
MSEASKDRRFPIGLTIATLIAFGILCALGVWQVKRLAWKQDLLARIEVLKTAPPQPLATVLARARAGEDVAWTRVKTACTPLAPTSAEPSPQLVYGVRDGDIVWRAMTVCGLKGAPNDLILVDLGVVTALTGQTAPKPMTFKAPAQITGVLMSPKQLGGDRGGTLVMYMSENPASEILMLESATPAVPGVTPAPLPAEITNRHLEYALTWFGLAVTLLFIYAAMLWRKMRS